LSGRRPAVGAARGSRPRSRRPRRSTAQRRSRSHGAAPSRRREHPLDHHRRAATASRRRAAADLHPVLLAVSRKPPSTAQRSEEHLVRVPGERERPAEASPGSRSHRRAPRPTRADHRARDHRQREEGPEPDEEERVRGARGPRGRGAMRPGRSPGAARAAAACEARSAAAACVGALAVEVGGGGTSGAARARSQRAVDSSPARRSHSAYTRSALSRGLW